MKKKMAIMMAVVLVITTILSGCSSAKEEEKVELTILAAASLTDVCDELKAEYEAEHENVTLTFSYGGSGALQAQIEEGAPADIFISAATKQMDALKEEGLMDDESIEELLENKVVLIVPKDSTAQIASFTDLATSVVSMVGLGEPGSVPVGQYSEEILTSLDILDQVKAKANYGSDVRTVLSWVEESAVDCGIVYATDAYTSDKVKIVCEAPEGSCARVIYPMGIVKASEKKDAAAQFLEFLKSSEAAEKLRCCDGRLFSSVDITESCCGGHSHNFFPWPDVGLAGAKDEKGKSCCGWPFVASYGITSHGGWFFSPHGAG